MVNAFYKKIFQKSRFDISAPSTNLQGVSNYTNFFTFQITQISLNVGLSMMCYKIGLKISPLSRKAFK